MKRPFHDDEVHRLHELLKRRIDVAAKSVAEALQVAADLMLAMAHQETDSGPSVEKVEAHPVPQMMTPQQAADYLGVKASTLGIWRCRRSYPIPFVKVGSKVYYRKADLDEFLQSRTQNRGLENDSG
jgi:excisionase family DNA binding protein